MNINASLGNEGKIAMEYKADRIGAGPKGTCDSPSYLLYYRDDLYKMKDPQAAQAIQDRSLDAQALGILDHPFPKERIAALEHMTHEHPSCTPYYKPKDKITPGK
jgi:Zn-dependent protease with chaperone function